MKKLLLLAGFLASSSLGASQIFVESSIQEYLLSPGVEHVISLSDTVELRALDIGDPDATVFKLSVVGVRDGVALIVCENLLKIPFGSEATLVFTKRGMSVRFVASVPDDGVMPAPINPNPDEIPSPDPDGVIVDGTTPGAGSSPDTDVSPDDGVASDDGVAN